MDHQGPLDTISKIIPNPLTDTITTAEEGHRPDIHSVELRNNPNSTYHEDRRQEDSWNSNTLTLNNGQGQSKGFKRISTTTQMALDRQHGLEHDWEETWEKERLAKRQEKVQEDLKGWRGGHG
jgi:hypothetical protein